jgi:23S rRNA (cytidine2498-2'-O)-methyltransferase
MQQVICSHSALSQRLAQGELKPYAKSHRPLGNTVLLAELDQSFTEFAQALHNAPPIFIQHICPAQLPVQLSNTTADLDALTTAALTLEPPPNDLPFAVQTRMLDGQARRGYGPFDVNQALANSLAQRRHVLNVQKPQWVISVVIVDTTAYLGASTARQNRSDWAGGQRRFREAPEQISRAEFKLLEALEVFELQLPTHGNAADLGAAPGGWTRVLRQRGLAVWAIDPGELHISLRADPGVRHCKIHAEAFGDKHLVFDVVVNDMRMDIDASARIVVQFAQRLKPHGLGVMTLKLPPQTHRIREAIDEGLRILSSEFEVLGIRQLFHNRHEATVALRKRKRIG